jgi:tetratricopeptide (TPR) repeat protein
MEAVQPQVHVELLVNLMLELVSRNYTGLVRAGYTAPQPDFLRRRDFSATQAGQDGLSQLEDSVGLLRLSIREQPADAKAWFHLGQTLAQLQQHEGAITAFDRCTALRAQNEQAAWSAYMSAKSLAHLGLWEEAIERCVVGMAADAHTPELAWMCSWCYYQIEDFRQAIVWSRIAIALGCVDGMGDIRNRGEYRDWIAWYDGPYDILSHALKQVGDESGSQAAWSRRLWASQQRESVFATM